MRVLVTGAGGFIGSNLCAALARRPGLELVALIRPHGDRAFLRPLAGLAVHEADITDPAALAAAMAGAEVVYHLAGYASDWGSWETFRALNVSGVDNVCRAALAGGARRLVHVSSVSVYGFPGGADLDEETPLLPRPKDRYITTKAEGERVARSYHGRGHEVAIGRPGGVYGANDRTTTLKLVPALLSRRVAFVAGAAALMAPAYIDNLTQLLALAGEAPQAAGETFNATDDGRTTWRQFIGWMCEDLAVPPPRLSLPAALAWPAAVAVEALARALGARSSPPINTYRLRAVMRDSHYSCAKAKRLLGYAPAVSTREGVRRTIAWWRAFTAAPAPAARLTCPPPAA
jgi:nucleoside-diphosphate-sugar epimerase